MFFPRPLLIVTGVYPPNSGGPAKFARQFALWLIKRGESPKILTYSKEPVRYIEDPELPVATVNFSTSSLVRIYKMVQGVGSHYRRGYEIFAVGAFIETYLASLLFRFSYYVKVPGDIVWERARNSDYTKNGIMEFQNENLTFRYRLLRVLYSQSLRTARKVIVPSVGLYELCRQWGVEDNKLILIYNSINTDLHVCVSDQNVEFDLVTVCRLAPWKGVDEVIRYASERKFRLAIVGDGPERQKLQELAFSLNVNATFFGDISSEAVYSTLCRSRVFVLNSYYEGLPHALIEARALGVLSVARADTGSAEVINDDIDGFLIRNNRSLAETLDRAMLEAISSGDYISRARNDVAQRFNTEANLSKILKVLKDLN